MRFIFFLLFANLIILDGLLIYNYLNKKEPQTNKAAATSIYTTVKESTTATVAEKPENCNLECQSEIAEKVLANLKLTPTAKPRTQQVIVQNPTSIPSPTNQTASTAKEFFIPLGTGSSTATDWTDVPGVKAEVNSNSYQTIKQVLFEASLHVPNANQIVEIRLYNETDKYVVSNSEILYPSGTTENFRITSIQLGQGAKTYKVQIKTQLGYTANLDQARIHITTK